MARTRSARARTAAAIESLEIRRLLTKVIATGTDNDSVYDSNGTYHLAWYDTATTQLKESFRTSAGWQSDKVIAPVNASHIAVAPDGSGGVGVVYRDNTGSVTLKYSHRASGSSSWETPVPILSAACLYPSLVFVGNEPVMSYYRVTSADLYVTSHATASWVTTALATTNDVGRSTSIAKMNSSNTLAIAYED